MTANNPILPPLVADTSRRTECWCNIQALYCWTDSLHVVVIQTLIQPAVIQH